MRLAHPGTTKGRQGRLDVGSDIFEEAWMSDQPDDTDAAAAAQPATTLLEEHALLRAEVGSRAEMVLREADEGRWPQPQLMALVDYLQLEVLRQVADEEWLMFRSARHTGGELAQLRADHLDLRLSIDTLTQAAASRGSVTPEELAAAVRDLLAEIDAHLAAEEKLLVEQGGDQPGVTSLGAQPHEWYALTRGPVIDMDQLPGPHGADAVLDRLLQLRAGERIEVRSTADLGPLWRRLRRAAPGGWGVTQQEQGPAQWRVQVVRRPAEPPLTPFAG